jgi:hypothetical protein
MSKQKGRFHELIKEIKADFAEDRRDDMVSIFIPSHDSSRPQKELTNQTQYAEAALRLFSTLYGGATAFEAWRGIWKDKDGTDLLDKPIIIESLVEREVAEDEDKLETLLEFAARLCRETNQVCVAVIFNDVIRFIKGH